MLPWFHKAHAAVTTEIHTAGCLGPGVRAWSQADAKQQQSTTFVNMVFAECSTFEFFSGFVHFGSGSSLLYTTMTSNSPLGAAMRRSVI